MLRIVRTFAVFAALAVVSSLVAAPVSAQGGLLTAATPDELSAALTATGRTVKVNTSGDDPEITVNRPDGDGTYDVYLMDCKAKRDCGSIELILVYSDNGSHSAELANQWNANHRMPGMFFNETDKTMSLYFNVSTTGGLTRENFTDLVKWYESGLGAADTFFSQHPVAKPAS